jgi:nicotinate phosphoribosyltransferase
MTKRLPVETFDLPVEKIRDGYYSAQYFNRTKHIVEAHREHVDADNVLMQVFQRHNAVAAGVDEAIAILKVGSGYLDPKGNWRDAYEALEVKALRDGDRIEPWEPVLTIRGDYGAFAHLESLYLGALARGTRVATNTAKCVEAAAGKPVLFFADRFDYFGTQERDGYAATLGGAALVATDAHGAWVGKKGGGTMPHALIAVTNGSVTNAGTLFRREFPDVDLIGLVDFNNDCVTDTIKMLDRHGDNLKGVRLDTSGNMVDNSLVNPLEGYDEGPMGDFKPTGVNPTLVRNVRGALDRHGGEHVKIYVSGGFTPEKIADFEAAGVPVDGYGVGSSLLGGNYDYTADIVEPVAKEGRWKRDACRLERVE